MILVSSPYVVVAISLTSILALIAIITTSNEMMNNAIAAQESIRIQTQKNHENLEITVSNDVLIMKNNGLDSITIEEIRIYSSADATSLLARAKFPEPGLQIPPLQKSEHTPSEFSITSFLTTTILGITDLGNIFVATNLLDEDYGNGTGNGDAMINGMGLNSRIVTYDYSGKLTHGYGDSGTLDSLKTYNQFSTVHDFAAQLLSTDSKTAVIIPQFNTEYEYVSQTQSVQVRGTTNPNILGYSQSRTVGGTAITTVGTDGITISGTGTVILKLNNYGDQTLVLEGNVPSTSLLQVGTDLQYDYINIPYDDTYGFRLYSGGLPGASYSQSPCSFASGIGYNCCASWAYTQSFASPLVLTTASNYYSYYHSTSYPFSILTGTQNPTTYSLNSIRMIASACSGWHSPYGSWPTTPIVPSGQTLFVFDKSYVMNTKIDLTSTFQTSHSFLSGKQYYLFAKPNGGTITIKGSFFNPSVTPYLKITDLPPNIPYEIVKDGFLAVSGMADNVGTVSLALDDVKIGGTNPNGNLYLYPNSLKYRGSFSTIVFDNVNNQTIHIDTPEDKVYVVHAYVQIPVIGDVEVTDTYLDNNLSLSYLNGNYTTGESIKIPVIPGYSDINMKINDVKTLTVIANVLGGTGLKIIPPSASTITQQNDNNIISSITSTTGSTSYVISTYAGIITTSITATISGDTKIENHAYFGAPPPPPQVPPPRDPLKAWVDVYKNGILINRQQIYFNALPNSQNSGGVSGSSSYVIDKYTYPQTVVNGIITTNVLLGDFVEFYLYANIQADGSTPPIPSGHIFYHYSGEGQATATIHNGSILSS